MKNIKKIAILLLVSVLFTSCYEDYIQDNETTATYFALQKPLRTIVPRDNSAEIEIAVVLSGLRNDDASYTVDFIVDTILLDSIVEAAALTLMPSEYYTLGGSAVDYNAAETNVKSFDLVKPFLRGVNVTFDVEKFTNDPLALGENYAIPLRIVSSTMDTIINAGEEPNITSGDITIMVVKYVSPYSGTYYSKGLQIELDAAGLPVDTVVYYEGDLSRNERIPLSTVSLSTVETSRIGKNISGSWILEVAEDGTLNVTTASASITNITINNATYDSDANTYDLDITFDKSGTLYHVQDQLILTQAIEKELRREEW